MGVMIKMVEINISGEEFLYELEYRRLITYNLHDNAFP